jgi:hypothetical protein
MHLYKTTKGIILSHEQQYFLFEEDLKTDCCNLAPDRGYHCVVYGARFSRKREDNCSK